MTEQEKQLLLIDICGRLSYETMFYSDRYGEECLLSIDLEYNKINELYSLEEIKPYLRPMSSMTDEERDEFRSLGGVMSYSPQHDHWALCAFSPEGYDWLNSHYFDYRELIEKGLALEAPNGMYI